MTARRGDVIAGAVSCVVALGALPAALVLTPAPVDLLVELRGRGPRVVLPAGGVIDPDALRVLPEAITSRLRATRVESAPQGSPGLALETFGMTWGARWEREVTVPTLRGPFDAEGTRWPCGFGVWVGPAMFDPAGAGQGLAQRVDETLRDALQDGGLRAEATHVRFTLEDGRVRVRAETTVSQSLLGTMTVRAQVTMDFRVRLEDHAGQVVPVRDGDVDTAITVLRAPPAAGGSTGGLGDLWRRVEGAATDLAGSAATWAANHVDALRAALRTRLDAGLLRVDILPRDWAPFPGRPDDRVALFLREAPRVSPRGVTMIVCPEVRLAAPRRGGDDAVTGPVHTDEPPPDPQPPPGDAPADVEVTATAGGINQVLYTLWRAGELSRWGHRQAVLSRLPERLSDHVPDLALRFDGIVPGLPPVVTADGTHRAMRLYAGDMVLGEQQGLTAVGHVALAMDVARYDGGLRMVATGTVPHVNCVGPGAPGVVRLTPCLSDLLPVLREQIEAPTSFTAPDNELEALAHFDVRGVRVQLARLDAAMVGPTPWLRVRARATTRVVAP